MLGKKFVTWIQHGLPFPAWFDGRFLKKMKQCPTCQEEFADKFGFCPVDGTPLGAPGERPEAPQASDESVVTEASTSAYSAPPAGAPGGGETETAVAGAGIPPTADGRGEFHLTFL